MILKLSKRALLSAMIFQAKKDARYYLNGICFAPDKKLYSSDGHRAFIGEHDSAELTENIIVSIRGQKITSFERAEIDTNAGLVLYLDDHGIRVGAGLCDVIDGRYPDIESVISRFKSKPTDEIGFNAGYLVDIEKAAKLFDPKFCCVKIKPNGNADASIIEFRSSSDKGTLVIMPMRLPEAI